MFQLHELLRAFGAHHGQMLNYAAVCRALGSSRLQVGRMLNELRRCGYVRLVPSLPDSRPADIIRKPTLYVRQRAWKQVFAPTPCAQSCMRVPVQGQLASRITDAIIDHETSSRRPSTFYSMLRYRARGIDLVVRRPSGWRIGFCFEPSSCDRPADPARAAMRRALKEGWINAAIFVSCRCEPNVGRGGVLYLSPSLLLACYADWTGQSRSEDQKRALVGWLNGHFQLVLGGFWGPEESLALDFQYDGLPQELENPFLPRPP